MVIYNSTKRLKYKSFNKLSKFVLLGNNIDGYVTVKFVEFNDFEDVKSRLPKIIEEISFAGEWNLSLYQVADNYAIKLLYGYYKVPNKGKLIFELDYNFVGEQIKLFINDAVIHFHFVTDCISLTETDESEEWNVDVYENYLTILLFEKYERSKKYVDESEIIKDEDYFLEQRGYNSFWEIPDKRY